MTKMRIPVHDIKEMGVVGGNIYIYIYIYRERERERERDCPFLTLEVGGGWST